MSKAGVPAHAQRMSSLLAADREEPCQVERGACDVRGARCAGGARDRGGRAGGTRQHKRRERGGPAWLEGSGGRAYARGGAHCEHESHVLGAGQVEPRPLIEGLRFLPSRKQGVRDAGRGVCVCGPEGAGELGRGVSVWGGGPGASGAHAQRTTRSDRLEG